MRNQIERIVRSLQSVLEGEPWFGRSVMNLLHDVDPAIVFLRPAPGAHSLIDLLYHMNTWAEFTLRRLQQYQEPDPTQVERLDWREINPIEHTWAKGVAQFKVTHDLIIDLLETKDDSLMAEKVDYREYDFGVLLDGIIQHDIYHIGQVAYLKKLLDQQSARA